MLWRIVYNCILVGRESLFTPDPPHRGRYVTTDRAWVALAGLAASSTSSAVKQGRSRPLDSRLGHCNEAHSSPTCHSLAHFEASTSTACCDVSGMMDSAKAILPSLSSTRASPSSPSSLFRPVCFFRVFYARAVPSCPVPFILSCLVLVLVVLVLRVVCTPPAACRCSLGLSASRRQRRRAPCR